MSNNQNIQQLTASQSNALAHIRKLSSIDARSRARIKELLKKYNISNDTFNSAMDCLQRRTSIAVHFHPDRLTRSGKNVVRGLLESGKYLSQFETGISSGSPSAYPGGERDIWELNLFGRVYHKGSSLLTERPKYGSVNIFSYPDGPSPRFGSCYFLLYPEVNFRSTFTFGGSQEADSQFKTGTIENYHPVLAALMETVEETGGIFGRSKLDIPNLFELLAENIDPSQELIGTMPLGRVLDSFIEAQVHGEIALGRDVKMLVCDRCYKNTNVGDELTSLSLNYGFPVFWHSGFRLQIEGMPEIFRGYEIRTLAERIAPFGVVDPAILGEGANSFLLEPELWTEFGDHDDVITRFRRLWHAIVTDGKDNIC